jgi:hypothetical protein
MAANLEIQNDAGVPITAWNFGTVAGGSSTQAKFYVENTGSNDAESVQIVIERLVQNDGVDYVEIALDSGGNPGTYQTGAINLGTLAAGAQQAFWVRQTIPAGATPQGNTRQFLFGTEYTGS